MRAFTASRNRPGPARVHHRSTRLAATAVTERATLGTGPSAVTFAPLINGCWQLAGGHGREVFEDTLEKLTAAADAGYTSFDTADIYGPSEGILGQFREAWAASGRTQQLQLFTKYVPNIFNARPTPASVRAAIQRSLGNLKVSQLDLVQMHWWDYNIPGMVDTALALAELKEEGLIKQVGLTNMNVEAVQQIMEAGVDVANNQVQFSLLDRRPLNGMLQYCESKGIKLFTYGSVAGGLLSDKYVEAPRQGLFGQAKYGNVDLNTSSLKMYWNVAKMAGGQDHWRKLLLVLSEVAQKHGVSVAAVALRWVMQQGSGSTVFPIVGFRGPSHLEDNARVLQLQLDQQDLDQIQVMLEEAKGPSGDCYSFERGL